MNMVSRAYNAFERTTAYGCAQRGRAWDESVCRGAWHRYMTLRQELFGSEIQAFDWRDLTGVHDAVQE